MATTDTYDVSKAEAPPPLLSCLMFRRGENPLLRYEALEHRAKHHGPLLLPRPHRGASAPFLGRLTTWEALCRAAPVGAVLSPPTRRDKRTQVGSSASAGPGPCCASVQEAPCRRPPGNPHLLPAAAHFSRLRLRRGSWSSRHGTVEGATPGTG